jgi:hypothetical protein
VWPLVVVMRDEDAQRVFEVAAAEDEQPVEALGADGAHEPLGVGVCSWCPDGRVDHLDPFGAEHLVEGGAELAVSVVDQKPCSLEQPGEAKVARLLGDPGAGRVAGATGEMDAAGFRVR